jgi:hypothetical protein
VFAARLVGTSSVPDEFAQLHCVAASPIIRRKKSSVERTRRPTLGRIDQAGAAVDAKFHADDLAGSVRRQERRAVQLA